MPATLRTNTATAVTPAAGLSDRTFQERITGGPNAHTYSSFPT